MVESKKMMHIDFEDVKSFMLQLGLIPTNSDVCILSYKLDRHTAINNFLLYSIYGKTQQFSITILHEIMEIWKVNV
jgi:hypothetical protein